MKITILCEGKTEKAFKPCLHKFLKSRLEGTMPALQFDKHDGPIPKRPTSWSLSKPAPNSKSW